MGIHIIKMPDIGEGIAEVELVGWHVKVGDTVAEDQPLADVMTDKATVEIPSPVVGRVVVAVAAVDVVDVAAEPGRLTSGSAVRVLAEVVVTGAAPTVSPGASRSVPHAVPATSMPVVSAASATNRLVLPAICAPWPSVLLSPVQTSGAGSRLGGVAHS